MNEGERAGRWAIAFLLIVGVTGYFTIFMIIFSFLILGDSLYERRTEKLGYYGWSTRGSY
jgi:hypothetical protein